MIICSSIYAAKYIIYNIPRGGYIVNILDHELVPRHEVMSDKEKKELLEKLGVQEDNLPRILDSDPIVKIIKAKPGQVLRIKRNSPTAGESIYYRIVAKG